MGDFPDSTAATLAHIRRVNELLGDCAMELIIRGQQHDQSKLEEPEKSVFDEFTPKLKDLTYGSQEYKDCLAGMRPAIDHHNACNSHHPEYYPQGIDGMSLFDLVEMMMDWKAAGERHADGGDIMRSIEINKARFGISPQLEKILQNTADAMGWLMEGDFEEIED